MSGDAQTEATQVLARFAASLTYEKVPERVREYTKNVLLDALACALAGHLGEETHQISALASSIADSRESSVIGGDRLSLAGATVLNGFLITAVTMCDVHRPTESHITPEVIPPALAIAERDDLGGRDLLVAIAGGCETATRIGLGLDYSAFRARGWHGPGVIGPFGAAAAVGRLLGLDGDAMARAYGLAGSQSAGTFAAWGTASIKFHQCRGALSGLMAGLLAQQKFSATREFLTARDGGLYSTYSNGGRPDAVIDGLGSRWELEQIALRLWPSASTIQGVVTAMFELIERHQVRADQVRVIRIAVSQAVLELHGRFARYEAKFDALLSAHYAAAVILHDRKLSLAQYEPARYDDAELRKFAAERVEVISDPALSGVQARVHAETAGGSVISARCYHPRGSPKHPLSRRQIEDKFRTYAKARLDEPRIEKVISMVSQLESMGSARSLMDLLRGAAA